MRQFTGREWINPFATIENHAVHCVRLAPSQPREPIVLTESPEQPFHKITLDLFYVDGQAHLVCAGELTGWLMIYQLPPSMQP